MLIWLYNENITFHDNQISNVFPLHLINFVIVHVVAENTITRTNLISNIILLSLSPNTSDALQARKEWKYIC